MIYHTPKLFHKIFKNVIWENEDDKIILSFDDGPDNESTFEILEVLKHHNIKSQFFITGNKIQNNLSALEAVQNNNHDICIHGFNHSSFTHFNNNLLLKSIIRTENILKENKFSFKNIYRPPYGFFLPYNLYALNKINYRMQIWSILSGDYSNKTDNFIIKNIERNIKQNSIIVFHDNILTRKRIKNLLNSTINRIKEMGFTF